MSAEEFFQLAKRRTPWEHWERAKTTKEMCFLMENLGLGADYSGKRANSPDKLWVLPRLPYTNPIAQVMVTAEETNGGRGKNELSNFRKPTVHFFFFKKASLKKLWHPITLLLSQTTYIAYANLGLSVPLWNKNREWERQTRFILKVSRLTVSLGCLLVSNPLVSSPRHLCDPSLSPQITAPSACRKCLGVFTSKNEGSTKIFSISTGTNFILHSCSVSAVPQRPLRIWLRYMETWLMFYEHFCDTFLKGQCVFPSHGRNEVCYFDRNSMFLTCSSLDSSWRSSMRTGALAAAGNSVWWEKHHKPW